jgi:uncharacterized membrane protein
MMTLQEKSLYHQIHPAKLFADWSTGLIALYPFWHHNLLLGLLIAFVPSIISSLVIVRFADLEKYKESKFGRYVRLYMTGAVEAIRFIGYGIMAVGAWVHIVWAIPIGLLIIILAWLHGVIFPRK